MTAERAVEGRASCSQATITSGVQLLLRTFGSTSNKASSRRGTCSETEQPRMVTFPFYGLRTFLR